MRDSLRDIVRAQRLRRALRTKLQRAIQEVVGPQVRPHQPLQPPSRISVADLGLIQSPDSAPMCASPGMRQRYRHDRGTRTDQAGQP